MEEGDKKLYHRENTCLQIVKIGCLHQAQMCYPDVERIGATRHADLLHLEQNKNMHRCSTLVPTSGQHRKSVIFKKLGRGGF